MKRLFSLVMTAVLMLSIFASGVFAANEDKNPSSEKLRVLISSTNIHAKNEAKAKYGVRWNFDEKGFTTNVTQQQYKALQHNKNLDVSLVNKVHLDKVSQTAVRSTAPSDQTPWGMEAIYNDPTIQATSGGSGVKVAILDTGTTVDHPDLAANVEQCKDFSSNRSPLINGQCDDKNGHGTHTSGTVLANGGADGQGIYGVAPDAKLWAYKVLGNSGFGYSDDIAAAIKHAADEGNRLGVHVVISMSLGSSAKDALIADACTYAMNNGALVVAAAGNSGPEPNTIGYPGGLADVVAVAALENVQENGTYRIADFSSRGNPNTDGDYRIGEGDVEVSAPGRAVESTWNDGGYNTISGTSMATPHISGLAAKIWAANPTMSNATLRAELQNRAKANDILGGLYSTTGDDIASGFGFPTVQ